MINLDKYKIERGVKLKTSQLTVNNYNPNKTTPRIDEAIKESLEEYGQVSHLLVRPDPDNKDKFIIIDGEHRLNSVNKEVYCNVIYDLSEDDAKKLTIIINETRGKADPELLSNLLADLTANFNEEELQKGLPYEHEELMNLINLADENPELNHPDDFKEYDESLETNHQCPKCGYEW